jgi:hypothetical protein
MKNELDLFKEIWEREAAKTLKLLESGERPSPCLRSHARDDPAAKAGMIVA